jgi:hypothetical protein
VPSLFNLDLVRASLGPQLASPYEAAFGAVPWLTAGTLAWPAEEAERVLSAWLGWSAPPLSAIRLGASEVAVDVALQGDPWGVRARIEGLRDLAPRLDTVALVDPRMLRSPALVAAAELPLAAAAPAGALLAAASAMPEGVCLGLRRAAPTGFSLIGVGAAVELPRALAALDQAACALADEVEVA